MKSILPFLLSLFTLCIFSCANEKSAENKAATNLAINQSATPATAQNEISLDDVMGRFQPAEDPRFVPIEIKYASREGMFLHKDTYAAFEKMHAAAAKEGIELVIRSATRNFFDQKRIWENKWNGKTLVESGQNLAETVSDPKERALVILRYSSMPGSSRHHWGTDIDINNFENEYFESGRGLKEYNWLVENGPSFGFCQPYTAKDEKRPNGYFEEKWHWSYLPVAQPLTDFVEKNLRNDMIQGFDGSETAISINIKDNYMLGINKSCLH